MKCEVLWRHKVNIDTIFPVTAEILDFMTKCTYWVEILDSSNSWSKNSATDLGSGFAILILTKRNGIIYFHSGFILI